MDNENINKPQVTQENKTFFVCFIVGCVLGAIAVIASLITAISLFNIVSQINAGQGAAAIASIVVIPGAIACLILSVISSVLVGFGIKWKKLPSILALVAIILFAIVLVVSLIVFALAGAQ